jgi:hypothetical protein
MAILLVCSAVVDVFIISVTNYQLRYLVTSSDRCADHVMHSAQSADPPFGLPADLAYPERGEDLIDPWTIVHTRPG